MRALLFAAALASLTAAGGTGCAARSQPYRFSMPMLGAADVPPPALPAPTRKPMSPPPPAAMANVAAAKKPPKHYAYGWQTDTQAGIRVASARGIELTMPAASEESAAAVASGVVYSRLRAPHRPAPSGLTSPIELPGLAHIREFADLRTWVGRRDKRAPLAIVLGWLADLGRANDEMLALGSGVELVTWATPRNALLPPTSADVQPGDLLVFDRAVDHSESDLVGLAIGRDARGVTEFMYAGGGVIRRGFVDVSHASSRRDLNGAVLNTFLRHGRQWPAKGTRYLAGELLSHIVRTR